MVGAIAEITLYPEGGGSIKTNLRLTDPIDEDEDRFNGAIDGIEFLLLAMACEGIDVTQPKLVKAVEVAIEAATIANHLP